MVDWTQLAQQARSGGSGGSTGGMYGAPQGGGTFGGLRPSSGQGEPGVYMGTKSTPKEYAPGDTAPGSKYEIGGRRPPQIGGGDADTFVPQSEAEGRFYDLGWQGRKAFIDYLVMIGAIEEKDAWDLDLVQKFWNKGVEMAAGYAARGNKVTPSEALGIWVGWDGSGESAASRARAAAAEAGEPFEGVRTMRSETVSLSDPASAKALANWALSRALGREAMPGELEAYREALNDYESANPTVSTTRRTYEAQGDQSVPVSEKTRTSGGATAAGAQQTMEDLAREEPNFAEYQAAGPIWNAFVAALASPVSM